MPRAAAQETNSTGAASKSRTVVIDNNSDSKYTVVQVHARNGPGLLTALTAAFRDLDLSVDRADVDTSDGAIRDVFHVTDLQGEKVTHDGTLRDLDAALSTIVADSRQVAGRPDFASRGKRPGTAAAIMGMFFGHASPSLPALRTDTCAPANNARFAEAARTILCAPARAALALCIRHQSTLIAHAMLHQAFQATLFDWRTVTALQTHTHGRMCSASKRAS